MNKTNFKLFTMFLAGIAFSAMTVLAATISISTNFEDGVTQYLKKLVILKNNTTGMVLDGDTLSGKNIYGTNISGSNIHGSSIHGNTLSGINIYGTNISGNNIHGSLSGNNIKGTNITGINVYGTNISGNIIHGSSIHGNTLIKGTNITGTNVYGTNISGNNITGTNIKGNKISGQSGLFFQYCNENGQSCKAITELIPAWNKNNNTIYYNSGNVGIGTTNNPSEKLEVNGTGKFSGNITAKTGYFSGVTATNGTISATTGHFSGINVFGINTFLINVGEATIQSEVICGYHPNPSVTNLKFDANAFIFNGKSSFSGNISAKTGSFKDIDVDNSITATKLNITYSNNNLISANNGNIAIGYTNNIQPNVAKSTTTIKGNVKQLSTISQRVFTGLSQDEGASTYYPVFFPKGTLSGTQNEPLETDSKRYINCRKHDSTQHFYIHGSTGLAIIYKSTETEPRQYKNISYVLKFGEDGYFELKAGETFAVFPNQCGSGEFVVSKQEYGGHITPRSGNNGGFAQRSGVIAHTFP